MNTRNRARFTIAGIALGAALIAPAVVAAATVEPTAHEGNVTSCPDGFVELAFPGFAGHSTTVDGITVTTTVTDGGTTLAFEVQGGVVTIAYVKGGDNFNEYAYGMAGSSADSGLISPDNGGGNTPQISHSVFCASEVEEETPTEEEESPTGEATPSGDVDQETGTPEAAITPPATDAAVEDDDRSGDPTAILFLLGAVVLAAALSADRARAGARH